MISVPTVLILGAGASRDYGLPAGHDFRNQICNLAADRRFLGSLSELGVENAVEFLNRFCRAAYSSPDRFLEDYPQYIDAGKFCIAKVINYHENELTLFPPGGPDVSWYEYLVNSLDPGSDAYFERNLTIITFNYDRSLEHFMWNVIDSRFGDDIPLRDKVRAHMPLIIHVHGRLGPYDPATEGGIPYEPHLTIAELSKAQRGIRIIHQVDPKDALFDQAERVLNAAQRVYFLGFGFDDRNVRRLRYFPRKRSDTEIIGGTKTGISNHDWGKIVDEVFEGGINARSFDNSSIYQFLSKPGVLD